ncbi:ligase-associated DNA damage response endonuclease PdeM [Novosphingobium sp.]|uniref:ligase-associated DNA damage response endonuclease PdeM n=1 Tax=Novosphingobium sp. TaxID=1874826 RepID=UPI0025FC1017|nr:ligase-associated DNA damage response endonuclease PdeM [Novosphingobium sp.]
MVLFSFAGEEFALVGERALFWPRERALLVADLHLEKASFFARHGQMLPPYDSRETLERVAAAIKRTGARRVYCLGDNFHDIAGPDRLEAHASGMLDALSRATDWVWIAGNHDQGRVPWGTAVDELELAGIVLRHHAKQGEDRAEMSGHFHPRLRVKARGRMIARPCWVSSERKLILPAFGTLTGGMDASDPVIISAMQPAKSVYALLAASGRLVQFPVWRKAA